MILGVGYNRVYFGVHYITDIAAGYLAGLFCFSTAFLIIRDKRTASSGYRYISSYRNLLSRRSPDFGTSKKRTTVPYEETLSVFIILFFLYHGIPELTRLVA